MSESDMEPRVEHNELKRWVLEGLYSDHRSSVKTGSVFNKIMSLHSIADSYDGVFERPIENLMLAIFFVILGCDCEPEMSKHWRSQIDAILTEHNLDDLLAQITQEERFDFTADLRALGLMSTT